MVSINGNFECTFGRINLNEGEKCNTNVVIMPVGMGLTGSRVT